MGLSLKSMKRIQRVIGVGNLLTEGGGIKRGEICIQSMRSWLGEICILKKINTYVFLIEFLFKGKL